MKEKKISMDQVFFNTVISGLMFNKKLKQSIDILFDSFEVGQILNIEVY